MNIKKLIAATALIAGSLSFSTAAQASDGFQIVVNKALLGSSISCSACHNGATSSATAILPMATTYRAGATAANIANSDSDRDGFTNLQEANVGALDFNDVAVTPFTKAKLAAGGSTSLNVVEATVLSAAEVPITDVYAQTLIAAALVTEVAGGVATTLTNNPAKLYFPKPIVTGSKVYTVNTATPANTLLTTGIVFNQDGSVSVSGANGLQVLVDRAATAYTTSTVGAGTGDDDDDDDDDERSPGAGCLTDSMASPFLMFLAMLSLGLFIRRKND